ncbi:scabin-related ADP-ribosyltransferase [Streptomyces sp. NPDC054775]
MDPKSAEHVLAEHVSDTRANPDALGDYAHGAAPQRVPADAADLAMGGDRLLREQATAGTSRHNVLDDSAAHTGPPPNRAAPQDPETTTPPSHPQATGTIRHSTITRQDHQPTSPPTDPPAPTTPHQAAAAVQEALLAVWRVETLVRQSSFLGPGQIVKFSHVAAIVPALSAVDARGGRWADVVNSEVRPALAGMADHLRAVAESDRPLPQGVVDRALRRIRKAFDALDEVTAPQDQQTPPRGRPRLNPFLPIRSAPVGQEMPMSAPRNLPSGSRHGASRGHQGDPGPLGRGGFFAGAQQSQSPQVAEAGPIAGPSAPRVRPTVRPVSASMATELPDGTRAASRSLPDSPLLVELSARELAALRLWSRPGAAGVESRLAASGPGAHSLVVTEPQGTGYGSSLVAVNLGDRARVVWLDRRSGAPVQAPEDSTQVWSRDLDARSVLLDPPASLVESGPAALAFPGHRLPVTVTGLLGTENGSDGTGRSALGPVESRPLDPDWSAVLEEDANGFVPDPTDRPVGFPRTRAEAWGRVLASYERYAGTRAALREAAPYDRSLPVGHAAGLDPVVTERAAAQLRLEMDAAALREWGHPDPVALILQHNASRLVRDDVSGGEAGTVRLDAADDAVRTGPDVDPEVNFHLVAPEDRDSVVESSPYETLWRFSDVPPESVFTSGFLAEDANTVVGLSRWAHGNPTAQYVSTTRDPQLWFRHKRYRYEITPSRGSDATGVDVTPTLRNLNDNYNFQYEREVVFTGRIDAAAVTGVYDSATRRRGVWDRRQRRVLWAAPDTQPGLPEGWAGALAPVTTSSVGPTSGLTPADQDDVAVLVKSQPGETWWRFSDTSPEAAFADGFATAEMAEAVLLHERHGDGSGALAASTTGERGLWYGTKRYRYQIDSEPHGASVGAAGNARPSEEDAGNVREVDFTGRVGSRAVVSVYDRHENRTGFWDSAKRTVRWGAGDHQAEAQDVTAGLHSGRGALLSEEIPPRAVASEIAPEQVLGAGEVHTDRWLPFGSRHGLTREEVASGRGRAAGERPAVVEEGVEAFTIEADADGRLTVGRPPASGERTRIGYDWTWYRDDASGSEVLRFTQRLRLVPDGVSLLELLRLQQGMELTLDQVLNSPGYRLPQLQPDRTTRAEEIPGPRLDFRVEFVNASVSAHSTVTVRRGLPSADRPMVHRVWFTGVHPAAYVHEYVHGLGVRDDGRQARALLTPGGLRPVAVPLGPVSLMGPLGGPMSSMALMLTPEHVRQIAEVIAPYLHRTVWHPGSADGWTREPGEALAKDLAPDADYTANAPYTGIGLSAPQVAEASDWAIVENWVDVSSLRGRTRSRGLKAINAAVRTVVENPGELGAVRYALSVLQEWESGKTRDSAR